MPNNLFVEKVLNKFVFALEEPRFVFIDKIQE